VKRNSRSLTHPVSTTALEAPPWSAKSATEAPSPILAVILRDPEQSEGESKDLHLLFIASYSSLQIPVILTEAEGPAFALYSPLQLFTNIRHPE
jgi:hypothetical protein